MISFKDFQVDSVAFETAILSWELSPTHVQLDNFEFFIFRGETQISGSGITPVGSGLPINTFTFEDNSIGDIGVDKRRNLYYQIKVTDGEEEYFSEVKGINQMEDNKVALEIIRRDNIVFKNVLNTRFFLLKIKSSGQKCTCYDETLGQKVVPGDHIDCYNTTWVGGYYSPYMIYGNLGTYDENMRVGVEGQSTENITQLITGPFPKISVNDIIVDREGNRWRVGSIKKPKSKVYQYRQICTLQAVDRGDIVFQFPVNILTLR